MNEAADGSPNYWLWLDMDHLHSVIPMFNTVLRMLGGKIKIQADFGLNQSHALKQITWAGIVTTFSATQPQLVDIWKVDSLVKRNTWHYKATQVIWHFSIRLFP